MMAVVIMLEEEVLRIMCVWLQRKSVFMMI